MEPFEAIDRDGTARQFALEFEEKAFGDLLWIFRVWETSKPEPGRDFFYLALTPLGSDTAQIDTIDRNRQEWARHVGIIRTLMNEAGDRLQRRIVSSRANVEGEAEYRSIDAEQMWQNLQKDGLARYEDAEGRWVWIPSERYGV